MNNPIKSEDNESEWKGKDDANSALLLTPVIESSLANTPTLSRMPKIPARPSIGTPVLKRSRRCTECEGCERKPCGECKFCLNKSYKKACIKTKCSNPTKVPSTRKIAVKKKKSPAQGKAQKKFGNEDNKLKKKSLSTDNKGGESIVKKKKKIVISEKLKMNILKKKNPVLYWKVQMENMQKQRNEAAAAAGNAVSSGQQENTDNKGSSNVASDWDDVIIIEDDKSPERPSITVSESSAQWGVLGNAVTVQEKQTKPAGKEEDDGGDLPALVPVNGGDLPALVPVSAEVPVGEHVNSWHVVQEMKQETQQPLSFTDKGKMTNMKKMKKADGQQDNYSDLESDLKGYSGDVFPDMDSETLQDFKPPADDITKPFYFPSQIFRADIVVEHIEFILKHYHGKTLTDYNDFEFQIYTAKSKSLEEQTLMRLMERNAQCFRRIFYEKKRSEQYRQAREHVNQYVKSERSVDRNKKLLEQAKDNSQTLYLIVADEAHWGISGGMKTADKTQEVDQESTEVQGAHNTYINRWNHEEYPNVIVLQISATPYNLMTSSSRLPNDVQVAKLQGEEGLVHVKTERHRVYAYAKEKGKFEVTGEIGPMRNLHCIEWSDGLVKDFQGGVIARIQIPKESGILWLKAEDCERVKSAKAKKLVGTGDIEDSDEFILETSNGSDLKMYTLDKQYKMVVTKDTAHKNIVRMLPSEISYSKKTPLVDIFQLKLNFGEDIMELYCPGSERFPVEEMLFYHHDNREMTLGRLPADDNPDDMVVKLFPRHDLKYEFMIYSWRREGAHVQDKQYLSLNHYYNSMRDDKQLPLLKYDHMFEKYKASLKSTECDALLIAEYAMFILMHGCLNELDIDKEFESSTQLLLFTHSLPVFDRYLTMKKVKFDKFKKSLHKAANETISDSDFDLIVRFYEDEASNKLLTSSQNSGNEDRLEAFMWQMLFGNDKASISKTFINTINESFGEPVNFNHLKHKILNKIETYNVVKDLIREIDDS